MAASHCRCGVSEGRGNECDVEVVKVTHLMTVKTGVPIMREHKTVMLVKVYAVAGVKELLQGHEGV
jgi:hypothetical protein